jgi:hypothetical protein
VGDRLVVGSFKQKYGFFEAYKNIQKSKGQYLKTIDVNLFVVREAIVRA